MTAHPNTLLHSLVTRVRQYRREIAWSLNAVGLSLTLVAAFILYLYPPRFAPAYTESGERKVTFVNPATPEGLAYAKQWDRYARVGPPMLVVGFLAQLAAAIFDAPFWTHLSPRQDRPAQSKGGRASILASVRRSSKSIILWLDANRVSALSTLALVIVTGYYAHLTHRLVLFGVEPSIAAGIDPETWRSPNTFIVHNGGAESVVNTIVNIRCLLVRDERDTNPRTYFQGLPWDQKRSWWQIGTLGPKVTVKKEATEFLSLCFKNRENDEKFENEKTKAEAAREGRPFVPLSFAVLAAFDVSYQREVDGKSYRVSHPAWVLRDGKTGGPTLHPPFPISTDVKSLLEHLRRSQ